MNTTLVGIFNNKTEAQMACNKLEAAGIPKRSIQLTCDKLDTDISRMQGRDDNPDKPGAIGRFFASLFGTDDEVEASHYAEAVNRGNAVLTVRVDDDRVDNVTRILENNGALDVDEHVEQWKATGYTPRASQARSPTDIDSKNRGAKRDGKDVIEVVEEALTVGKRTVQKGAVRIHRGIEERPVEEQVSLHSERAVVERKKVDRPATEADLQGAFKEKNIEIRETAEEPVVSKSARVVEEVRVGKQATDRTEIVRDKVRRTTVDVQNVPNPR